MSLLNKLENNTPVQNSNQLQCSWFLQGCCSVGVNSTRTIIRGEAFTLGRRPDCDLTLGAGDVSGNHAEINALGDVVILKDLNSTNGTYVNGHRITEPTPVGEGDLLQFASLEFQLGREDAAPVYHTCQVDSLESGWSISQMNQVLNLKKFWMAYQPIFTAKDIQHYAVEALLRCDLPGLESPYHLFQTAEQLGLETELSTAAREQAAEDISVHPPKGRLFVNTHPHEVLGPELIASVKASNEILGDWKLVVEVHEAAVPDLKTILEFKQALHALGIELAYDDFGAGQSRLRELVEVPPDYVKFDRCMVAGLSKGSGRQAAIVESLVHFCRDNDIKTIAEGIDDEQDGDICRKMEFDYLQGFFYGRPTKGLDFLK